MIMRKLPLSYQAFILLIAFSHCIFSCSDGRKHAPDTATVLKEPAPGIPGFNADSAYRYIENQMAFGPRVPGTLPHDQCAVFLRNTLQRFCGNVVVQEFVMRAWDGTLLEGKNIIASYSPDKKIRIILCAHWDSRPVADHDPNPANRSKPVPGANDGASGTGVLLEIARQLNECEPYVGVDIILFDLEDYGPPNNRQGHRGEDNWGLGSQYWSRNPHKFNYKARFAILLDMVGVPDPQFLKEGFSMHYASDKVDKVWEIARDLGYGDFFPDRMGGYITDDHYYINKYAGIPAVNIIHLDKNSVNGSFFEQWHTVNDDMEFIDKATLDIVGTTVLNVVFREK